MFYDVIVIGAGHAGCEAALAAARMGRRTLMLTGNLDGVATMPCNPSVGGPAKGHVTREIDALGGEMGRNTDRTFIQIRMLNTSKGPAVQVPRAQSDKRLYGLTMKHVLERQPGLDLKQAMVQRLEPFTTDDREGLPPGAALRVHALSGASWEGRTVVVTTGTFLSGRLIMGESIQPGGRAGEAPAQGLSDSLRALGHELGRLKTGTPPRVNARTIDFSQTEIQPGSDKPIYFSYASRPEDEQDLGQRAWFAQPANPVYPNPTPIAWRPQLPCYLVHTNERTHAVIRANLHRAPMYSGVIQGVGPRYCPSIEDKIVRFAHKDSHGLFLEPEGWDTHEVYVQGANTSLPEDVQAAMIRSIPALADAEIMRLGYAVEYDYVVTSQTLPSLESKQVANLYFAGQINGTSGYEEAAGQGLIAGINAALRARDEEPLILRRDQAYIGVMIDDLVTRDHTEPYRLMTSRAEYRLLLRQDNADLRLTPLAYRLGLVSRERFAALEEKRDAIDHALRRLARVHPPAAPWAAEKLVEFGLAPPLKGGTSVDFLRRPEVTLRALASIDAEVAALPPAVAEQVEIEAKYAGYLSKQAAEVDRFRRLEERPIPPSFDYLAIRGFKREAQDKLSRFRPATVGQAARIAGVTPADVALLLAHLERRPAAVGA